MLKHSDFELPHLSLDGSCNNEFFPLIEPIMKYMSLKKKIV